MQQEYVSFTSAAGPSYQEGLRSREERLRDLERERRLYAQIRALSDDYPKKGGSSASLQQQHHQEGQHRDDKQSDNLPDSAVDYISYQKYKQQVAKEQSEAKTTSQHEGDVCFATDYGGLRGKIKVSRDGKHSFIDLENNARNAFVAPYNGAASASIVKSIENIANAESKPSQKQQKAVNSPSRDSQDAFTSLVKKEHKKRSKYHVSEKALLEEERAKYNLLEESYTKLLKQVQQLQATHLQDIRNTESRFHTASNTLQKALVVKSEENLSLSNQLSNVQAKYERELREWAKERAGLLNKVEFTEKAWKEADGMLQDRETRLNELGRLRKDLSERVASREQELIKQSKMLREREGDWMKEKESRMKLEVKALKLEETIADLESTVKSLKDNLDKKQTTIEDLTKVKAELSDVKLEIDNYVRRERNMTSELEQVGARERKLYNEIEDLSAQQRKYANEVARLTSRQGALLEDLESFKASEARMKQELEAAATKASNQAHEIDALDQRFKHSEKEKFQALKENESLNKVVERLRKDAETTEGNIGLLKNLSEQLQSEVVRLNANQVALNDERYSKQLAIDELQLKLKEVSAQLESEIQSKGELRQQSKDKVLLVSQKINELQNTLAETQLQLQDLRDNEAILRQNLRQREETIRSQNESLVQLQGNIAELQAEKNREAQETEAFKSKKRDEALAMQEKFNNARSTLEQESQSLRKQLQMKIDQLTTTTEEVSRIKVEMSELSADRFNLEARVSELLGNEASYQRQILNLQQGLGQKTQEFTRLLTKQHTFSEQVRRLEDELQTIRSSQHAAHDGDVARLQTNMEELSKRLKSQVDLLMTQDHLTVANSPKLVVSSPLIRSVTPNADKQSSYTPSSSYYVSSRALSQSGRLGPTPQHINQNAAPSAAVQQSRPRDTVRATVGIDDNDDIDRFIASLNFKNPPVLNH